MRAARRPGPYRSNTHIHGPGDIVSTAVGFWLTLVVLMVISAVGIQRLTENRRERE
ncbi:MAG: hypothetical protein ACT4NY_31625 [Pseudonocardiales bacterium]